MDGRPAVQGRTCLDPETEVVLAAPIYHGDVGDPDTMVDSVTEARVNLSEAGVDVEIDEAVADNRDSSRRHERQTSTRRLPSAERRRQSIRCWT